jgi:hypothetical protein
MAVITQQHAAACRPTPASIPTSSFVQTTAASLQDDSSCCIAAWQALLLALAAAAAAAGCLIAVQSSQQQLLATAAAMLLSSCCPVTGTCPSCCLRIAGGPTTYLQLHIIIIIMLPIKP